MATVGDFADNTLAYRATNAAGTTGGAAGVDKLWLPLWSGEVINAYDQYNVFESIVTSRTLSGGFSYEFPITGTVTLKPSWNAGEELVGGDAASTTFKVNLDKRPMAAHFECDNIDLLITQWDYRNELARQAGLTLANTRDKQLAMALVASGVVIPIGSDPRALTFHDAANVSAAVLASACGPNEALKVLEAIEAYLVANQEKDLPVEGTCLAVTPKVFQAIRSLGIPNSTENSGVPNFQKNPMFTGGQAYGGYGPNIGMGLATMPESLVYMGVKIIKTNHFGKVNHSIAANSLGSSKYNLNLSPTTTTSANFSVYGVIFQAPAIASLSLMGMKVDTVQDVRRNTQFTVASMLKGTGVIRPELCKLIVSGEISSGSNAINTRAELAAQLEAASTTSGDVGVANTNFSVGGFQGEYAVTSA